MKRLLKFWKIVVFDAIGVFFMLLAIVTGWLPGPGGIPLFVIGLSILAIHHEWAEKYIDKIKDYVESFGSKIFNDNKRIQKTYDLIGPILIGIGAYVLYARTATWHISVGIFMTLTGTTLILGNKRRLHNLKQYLKKHKN